MALVEVAFQGETKRALVEMSPFRFDERRKTLRLARKIDVVLSFQRRDPRESVSRDVARGRREPRGPSLARRGSVIARLATTAPGLYAVSFEELFSKRAKALPTPGLRLSRLGETAPFHVEPDPSSFRTGSTLFFLSEGASKNPYGNEAVFELEIASGRTMPIADGAPSGPVSSRYWRRLDSEENRLYQAGLLEAEDLWQWDVVLSGTSKTFPFQLTDLAPVSEPAELEVHLQGGSDFGADPDHHVVVRVNGSPLGEARWDGKTSRSLSLGVPLAILRPGENVLEIENVGDTPAPYSMVFLDRFSLEYPREVLTRGEVFRGRFSEPGQAVVPEVSYVLDVTGREPLWLSGADGGFAVQSGRSYLAVPTALLQKAAIRRPVPTRWKSAGRGADYVAIGPREFLEAARPLVERRRSQGLRVALVPIEEIYDEFGFGEKRPEALKEFLAYAYHHWRAPSLRYVVLLGDASYDFKDYLGTGAANPVPPYLIRTSYLWTASDPAYASVNGDDLLPDLAIGRLPAASAGELRTFIDKMLAWEDSADARSETAVLVTDNPDASGDFDANGDEIESTVLAGLERRRISLARLGVEETRRSILEAQRTYAVDSPFPELLSIYHLFGDPALPIRP